MNSNNSSISPLPTAPTEQTFAYKADQSLPDDSHNPDGSIQPHWQYLLKSLQSLGSHQIEERQKKAQRILRDDGATFKIYDEPEANQQWQLNPVPLLITSDEWQRIESGLIERAELFNLILQDFYGEKNLIRHKVIPPELLFSHQGFLRACHGVKLPSKHQLILHAADLVRNDQGDFCVMSDRTQAPSGAGYALENRTVMNRVFPSLFRDCQVHRLSLFFSRLRQALQELNPNGGNAQIVVLTPGIYNEAYFEHAYLANYLGFPLVQGGDLTVRNGYLWMKSLEGLKRVDVILRRVDDVYCDPVELRGDSRLGVPGLLEVARMGRVAIANPLGSGVLENPALLRYLPEISKALLGRELRLNSVKTWWCGNPNDLDYVCQNLQHLLIKPTYRRPGLYEVYGAELDDTKLLAWQNRIRKNPHWFTAQEFMLGTSSPSWHQQKIQPRRSLLRSFSVSSNGSYSVMPGGLTRTNLDLNKNIISSQGGSVSKDTWVLASEPEKINIKTNYHLALSIDAQDSQPSRVVENLFWMGRYAERAESALRLLRTLFIQMNKTEPLSESVNKTLLTAITHVTSTYPGFTALHDDLFNNPQPELISIILDQQRMGSIANNLQAMIASAEQVREQFSSETQRVINTISYQLIDLKSTFEDESTSAPEEALSPLISSLLSLAGLIQESMSRDQGWRFIEIGRRLERSLQIASGIRALLTADLIDVEQDVLLESALLSSEALITYRRIYQNGLQLEQALDLMLLNTKNPRSLIYQLTLLESYFKDLPEDGKSFSTKNKLLLEATTNLRLSDISQLTQSSLGVRNELDQLLSRLQYLITQTAKAISQRYFDHAEDPQLLVKDAPWQDPL